MWKEAAERFTLPSGVPVVIEGYASKSGGCFGYINGVLHVGDTHHALIIYNMMERGEHDWDSLMSAEQKWGWYENYGDATTYAWARNKVVVKFTTDEASQTQDEVLDQKVADAIAEYCDKPGQGVVDPRVGSGWSNATEYGERTRGQYLGEGNDSNEYCELCGEWYNPDYEDHTHQEWCPTCGVYYSDADPEEADHHTYDDQFCDKCNKWYAPHEENYHKNHPNIEQDLPRWVNLAFNYFEQHNSEDPSIVWDQARHWLISHYDLAKEDANKVVQAAQNQGEQLKLFSYYMNGDRLVEAPEVYNTVKKAWREPLASLPLRARAIARIQDIGDKIVFAKLSYDAMTNPYPDNEQVLKIENDPASIEYRWSYDGDQLHIWPVPNRWFYGPSHYDMFGSDGYADHSQGRVYVSPTGEVGILYWQITHPEAEQALEAWVEKNYGHPADYVYRAYGPYQGVPRSRWDFPIVDPSGLPLRSNEKWWEQPGGKPEDMWTKQAPQKGGYPAPQQKTNECSRCEGHGNELHPYIKDPITGELREPGEGETENVYVAENCPECGGTGTLPDVTPPAYPGESKRERRRRRREERRDRKRKDRARGKQTRPRRGGIEPSDIVRKFVFQDGKLKVGDKDDYYFGDIHHVDLLDFDRDNLTEENWGFQATHSIDWEGIPLESGDVFFGIHPTPEQMQQVKNQLGAKRIRWPDQDVV